MSQELDHLSYVAVWQAGAEAMRRACLAAVDAQIKSLDGALPDRANWTTKYAANTCRAVAHAIEHLPVPALPALAPAASEGEPT